MTEEKALPDPRLVRIRRLVLAGRYRVSSHVHSSVADGEIDFDAIPHSIVNAVTMERHRDQEKASVDGWKYVITGPDAGGLAFRTVGKTVEGPDGEEYFVITAFEVA